MIHEDHAAQVFYQPGSAPYLVITFSEMTMTADGVRFWGKAPLRQLSIPSLGFVHKRRRWFADDFMRKALAAGLKRMEAHQERITYGFSMGGYGAIRHAVLLGARTAVACSPQWTIEPAKLDGVSQPFAQHYRPDKHLGMELTSFPKGGRLYLLYDPHDSHDAWHADRIYEHIPEAVLVRMPFIGHDTVRAFASTPLMGALLEAARSHDDELVNRLARHARRAYPRRAELLRARRIQRRSV